jgi:ABC-type transport system involved in multi-copper enzyme maturation permease subunit
MSDSSTPAMPERNASAVGSSGGAAACTGAGAFGWLRRIRVLAGHTFTQLVRMKVFYFVLVFTLVLFVVGFLLSSVTPDQELKLLKDTAFGAMQIFGWVFGIVGMALLLPKDLEDRTLYTILSKPVRRHEYLLGKFFGVLSVLAVSLLVMDALFSLVLHLKHQWAVRETLEFFTDVGGGGKISEYASAQQKAAVAALEKHALHWDLQLAVLAIFFKSAVITAVAMFISTFSGSTIFTILASLAIVIVGHLQSTARESFLAGRTSHHTQGGGVLSAQGPPPESESGPGPGLRIATAVVSVLVPDLEVYGVIDAITNGESVSATDMLKMTGLTLLYLCVFVGAAMLSFSAKEL